MCGEHMSGVTITDYGGIVHERINIEVIKMATIRGWNEGDTHFFVHVRSLLSS